MIYLAIFTALLSLSHSKPLSSCGSQMQCLDLDVTEHSETDSNGNKQYELCLFWRKDLPECTKDDTISHACPSPEEGSKIEGWSEGRDNAMCNIVSCDGDTVFAIKDGKGCDDSTEIGDFGIANYDKLVYCYDGDGGDCGNKNSKACRWFVTAPDCEEEPTTTLPGAEPTPILPGTEPTPTLATCQCPEVFGLPLDEQIASCVTQSGCALLEGHCVCHGCHCETINEMVLDGIPAPEEITAQCNACDCIMTEGCESINYADMYSRDGETGMNTNENWVVEESEAGVAENARKFLQQEVMGINIGILIIIAVALVIGLVVCGAYVCYRYQSAPKMDKVEEESDDEVMVSGDDGTQLTVVNQLR